MSTRSSKKRDDTARALLGALPDLSPEETGSVFEELARICGVDLGRDEKAWSEWIEKRPVGQEGPPPRLSGSADDQLPPSPEVLTGLLQIAADRETADGDARGPAEEQTGLPLVEGYELLAKIGEGGMGTVYKAQQLSLKRTVAIKILQDKFAGDKAFIARFTREARLAAALTHLNVVRAVDAGVSGGKYYFAMEYVDGETVKAILKREGLLPERRAAEIALQIARALEYARTQGLIHRDVKPDNILIDREGTAMLADMGLARISSTDPEAGTQITRVATMMGTPDYISPEQARCQDDIDTRTDVYALGSTLFHMVTGRPPFTGESQADVISKHLNEAPPRADEVSPRVGRGTSVVIRKAMEKERNDRYRTPGEMASDLEDVLRHEAPRIVSAESTVPPAGLLRRLVRPRWIPVAAACAVFALAAGGFLIVGRVREARARGARRELLTQARESISRGDHERAIRLLAGAEEQGDGVEVERLLRQARAGRHVSAAKAFEDEGDLAAAITAYELALRVEDDESVRGRVADLRRREELEKVLAAGDRLFAEADWKGSLEAYRAGLALARVGEREQLEAKIARAEREHEARLAREREEKARREKEAAEEQELARLIALGDRRLYFKPRNIDGALAAYRDALEIRKTPELERKIVACRFEKAFTEGLAAEGKEELDAAIKAFGEAPRIYEAIPEAELSRGVRQKIRACRSRIAVLEDQKRAARELAQAEVLDPWSETDMRKITSALDTARRLLAIDYRPVKVSRLVRELDLAVKYRTALSAARGHLAARRWREAAGAAGEALAARSGDKEAALLLARARKELERPKTFKNSVGMVMLLIPAGEFTMGSDEGEPDERPARSVYLDSYYVGKHEVTNAQFERFRPGHRDRRGELSPADDMPAVCVSWADADAFCRWLSDTEARSVGTSGRPDDAALQYRLPTEAEWEKAARGVDARTYPWGDEAPGAGGVHRANLGPDADRTRWADDGYELLAPVGSFAGFASPCGALDMAGNVWEWCGDWYAPSFAPSELRRALSSEALAEGDAPRYAGDSAGNPLGPSTGRKRVLRGGGFTTGAAAVRAANRAAHVPEFYDASVGFRCVMVPRRRPAGE